MTVRRLLLLLAVAALVLAALALDLDVWLSFESLQMRRGELVAHYRQTPAIAIAVYVGLYVLVTALSLPFATVLTLAGGAVFGLAAGTLATALAATIGATISFWLSRYLLRDWIRGRFPERLRTIDEGVRREGGTYLAALRLVPLFPFWAVNLLMGLTPIRTGIYFAVSLLTMIPGTFVYVNAGTRMGELESASGILSPAMLASFALLGAFPWLARRAVDRLRARRVYRGWRRPKRFDRDLVVIGAGAAGLVSSYIGATVRAKVTLVEAHKMGGDCLNYGCVPSKALIRSAKLAAQMRRADRYGLHAVEPEIAFRDVLARVGRVVAEIEPHDSVERYTGLGVDVRTGHARLVDPWTVEINDETGATSRLTARGIILATGAAPFVPPLPGLEAAGYLTSDTLWDALSAMDAPPARLVVLGGGPIGCELAQAMARLGSSVTLVEMAPRLLMREDDDVSAFVAERLGEDGVDIRTGHKALRVEAETENRRLIVENEGAESAIGFDVILVAVGRAARLRGYGLEELGIPADRTIEVNEYLQTRFPHIYAAGDVAGPWQFTHTAAHQAWYASVNALFGEFKRFKVDGRVIPAVTFVDPEVARVGLNEAEARAQGTAFEVTRYGLDDLDRAIADSGAHGFVKVLTAVGSDRILGVTIVGEHAGELLAEWVLAMKHGLGLNKILGTIHAYPTWAESAKYAAGEWKRARKPERLLQLTERWFAWRRG